ncbi:MAG: glycosyltransferase [Sulfurifustis sp.]
MRILAISFDLPPLLRPQAIQIGRLLAHLPERFRLHMVTASDPSAIQDHGLYPHLYDRFASVLQLRFRDNWLLLIARTLARVILPIPDAYLFWHLIAAPRITARWQRSHFDCIATFAFPMSTNLLGLWLRRRWQLEWVAFFSDPWTRNPYFKYGWLGEKVNAWLERRVVEAATALVFPSEEMRDRYASQYPGSAGKMRVISHSFDPSLYARPVARSRRPLLLRYVGNFYGQRTATTFLTALGRLKERGDVREGDVVFETVGTVSRKHIKLYEQIVRKYDLGSIVRVKPPVPYAASLQLMQEADVLVLLDAAMDGSVYFPSKLADYVGAGRPVLGLTPEDGASARVLRRVGGWIVPPGDIGAIQRRIVQLLEYRASGRLEEYIPSKDAAQCFSIERNAQQVAKIFDELQICRT